MLAASTDPAGPLDPSTARLVSITLYEPSQFQNTLTHLSPLPPQSPVSHGLSSVQEGVGDPDPVIAVMSTVLQAALDQDPQIVW